MTKYVNASDISSVSYCPKSFELKEKGIKQNYANQIAMNNGIKSHIKETKYTRRNNDLRCYVATSIYGKDHFITNQLRCFRDDYLYQNMAGRIFVKLYYLLSPIAIKTIGNTMVFNKLSRKIILLILRKVRNK